VGARHGAVALVAAALLAGCGGDDDNAQELPAAPNTIEFSTPDFDDGAAIPKDITCDGAGRKPTLVWRSLPEGAIELVLVVYDQDAGFTHWTAWGIAASSGAGLAPQGQFPAGLKEGENSAGKPGWTPPCPPKGDDPHRYTFSLYAVGKGVTLEPGAKPDQVTATLKGALGRGTFSGAYSRQ
jgi:Raf kinase inhibitor-like YbhB/YbcL family protein